MTLTLSVAELYEYVRRTLASDPVLHGVRLRGELSNFKRHSSGHWYFTLKDEESAISCAMFRQYAYNVAFRPSDGQRVLLSGSVGLYVKTGQYQFYAERMEPDGVGDLFLRFEALKLKLQREGLFDPAIKKPLPLLSRGLGVITSRTGAVIHDIARVAWRRNPGMPIYLYPIKVQGEGAAEEIAAAIRAMDTLPEIDVLIVGRGGGSMEDLWAFNEEIVARASAECRKPVVSAVGHETDFTIADFVADVRAATPSAAAELAVESRDALMEGLQQCEARMRRACELTLGRREAALSELSRRLAECTPERQTERIGERVDALMRRLILLGEARLNERAQAVAQADVRLALRCEGRLARCEHALAQADVRVRAAGPQQTLKRGYALVQQGARTVQSVGQADAALPIRVIWRDGAADARITHKEEQSPWR